MENRISPIKRGFGLSFYMYSSLHLQLVGRTQQVEGAEGRGGDHVVGRAAQHGRDGERVA